MHEKLTEYSTLAIKFVKDLTDNKSREEVLQTANETQLFVIKLLEDIVYINEVNEEFEEAALNLKIANALYTPLIMYFRNCTPERAEEHSKQEIDELINSLRLERDGEENNEIR